MKLYVGTSGYSYKEWLGNFYPERLPAKEMLHFYGQRLSAVEINNTFYRLPNENVLASWAAQVPEEFRFAIKASRRITHIKRLKQAAEETAYLLRAVGTLGVRLGAVLFQLPPNLRRDLSRLEQFLDLLPSGTPAAFEFRHVSWFEEEVFKTLRDRRCALCLAETDDGLEVPMGAKQAWGYVRLRRSGYSDADLSSWRERILSQPWERAYVFFKHEERGIGPKLAGHFIEPAQKRKVETGL